VEIEKHKVVEDPHKRVHGRPRHFLVDRHAPGVAKSGIFKMPPDF
jgi:hypothetical protein